jgi:cytochrome c
MLEFHDPQQHAASVEASAQDQMIQYGCPTCHVIPHEPGVAGKVGPSLEDLAQRSYLAGTLQNSPENLTYWIQYPQHTHPGTAMPEMGLPRRMPRASPPSCIPTSNAE